MTRPARKTPGSALAADWIARLGQESAAARHAAELARLSGLLRGCLPPALAGEVHLANVRDRVAVCHVSNGAVAARLKLMAQALAECLARKGADITAVRVAVQPAASRPVPPAEKRAVLSEGARASLEQLAGQVSGSPVEGAVRRLLDRDRRQSTRSNRSAR